MKYERFHLVLMATHACNLRCDYCYTGRKFHRFMQADVGRAAIRRAVSSLAPGGFLELGFFGGEPLLEADLVADMLHFAEQATEPLGVGLRPGITTNGTVLTACAWKLLTLESLDVCISHDGLPEAHDRHRRTDGRGGAEQVAETIRRLQGARARRPRGDGRPAGYRGFAARGHPLALRLRRTAVRPDPGRVGRVGSRGRRTVGRSPGPYGRPLAAGAAEGGD